MTQRFNDKEHGMYGMYGMYLGTWPALGRSEDAREALDRRTLYEARMATEFRCGDEPAKGGFVSRLRGALAGRPGRVATDACAA